MNVHWSSLTAGGWRAVVILLDLTCFVSCFLGLGFGAATRIYALTCLLNTIGSNIRIHHDIIISSSTNLIYIS